jgi:hypothetical protein
VALLCGHYLDRLRVLAMASVVRLNGGTIDQMAKPIGSSVTRDIRYGFEIPYDDVWHVMCLAFGWALKTNGCSLYQSADPHMAR